MPGSADAALTSLLHDRVRALNEAPLREGKPFVVVWLQGQRRVAQNLAVAHAQRRANELGVPLLVYEGLRSDAPFSCDRFHRFVLEGAADNAAECERRGLSYAFFLQQPGSPRGVLLALAARAALVVTDWMPAYIHPAQTARLAARAECRVEAVDAAGVMPLAAFPTAEIGARTLRPKFWRLLGDRLRELPEPAARRPPPRRLDWGFEPLALPHAGRGAGAAARLDAAISEAIARCAIDHHIGPVAGVRGGSVAARARLGRFLREGLVGYSESRSGANGEKQSGLSPYLHFGHLGPAEVARAVQQSGAPEADQTAFLEQLLVRRELALNFCARTPAHETIAALPGWAQRTLEAHRADPRPALLDDAALDEARTPDPVWNALQRQLRAEGRIPGALRMLWGKLILTWSRDAAQALARMATLNDRYALDGRDAISRTNFLWCLGLHDRPFPERPVFGVVRSMTSASALRKHDLGPLLARYGDAPQTSFV